ncbi:efflux transporter outer membrane subunit [Luteolibacter flavescens]|uniref:Efflux transporter outer membrane subunit n=1 Tax=Luteolibacter flavescens TaxID=1859460 RepID=A0ABT3FIR9_9BACT|nr:efflux transporter outer membrane subunit [Luteolibacter flavescens]
MNSPRGEITLDRSETSLRGVEAPRDQWRTFIEDSELRALIGTALSNNTELKSAMARIDAAKARARAAAGAALPTVEAAGGVVKSRSGRLIDDDYSDTGKNWNAGFQAAWELDLWGKIRSEKGAALHRLLASQEAERLVRSTLVAEVAGAYYELKALDSTHAVLARTAKLQEEAVASARAQLEAGKVTVLAVQQFEAQLKNIEARKLETSRMMVEQEGILRLLCGEGPGTVKRSKVAIEDAKLPRVAWQVSSDRVENRPDVMAAAHELEAAKADAHAAKTAFYPTVTIDGMLGLQAFRASKLIDSRSTASSIGGGIVAPLINRGALKAEYAEANAAQLEALHGYHQALLDGYVEAHHQMANLRWLDKMKQAKAEESELLNSSAATAGELFHSGRGEYLEVLTARQSALEADLEKIEIRMREFQASVNLYRALGGG